MFQIGLLEKVLRSEYPIHLLEEFSVYAGCLTTAVSCYSYSVSREGFSAEQTVFVETVKTLKDPRNFA